MRAREWVGDAELAIMNEGHTVQCCSFPPKPNQSNPIQSKLTTLPHSLYCLRAMAAEICAADTLRRTRAMDAFGDEEASAEGKRECMSATRLELRR